MGVLGDIRYRWAMKKLKSNVGKQTADSFKSLRNARSVGMIYNVEKISWKTVTKFIHHFESLGKSVTTIGFLDQKELNHNYTPNFKHMFFAQEDLDFWKLPKIDSIKGFLGKDYDYLINLDVDGELPLQAISAFSTAKTRIGLHLQAFEFCQDFMIKAEAKDGPELFEHINNYIK